MCSPRVSTFCTFSDDGWQCDLYAYQSGRGEYLVHVASERYPQPVPPAASVADFLAGRISDAEYRAQYQRYMDYFQRCYDEGLTTRPGGPYDGKTFVLPTREAAVELLTELAALGYRFPADLYARIGAHE